MLPNDYDNANDDAGPARPAFERRGALKWMGGGLIAALAASAGAARASEHDGHDHDAKAHRIYGSWHVQVAFLAGPNQGKTEHTLLCFAPGGIVVESDGTGPTAHFGHWTRKEEGSFVYHLVEFNYDSASQKLAQVVVPHIEFTVDADNDRIVSVATLTTIYQYDVSTGALIDTLAIPNVSLVTGDRITQHWKPATQL
ncbi:hypothetical protein LJR230_002213 [Trinickia sp. LjRoot230]|uniref:hypothetical protein n=1 Tax=Trinickia sp. LjRoot230 TaxID=3342288 RepID=UPI003ED09B4F